MSAPRTEPARRWSPFATRLAVIAALGLLVRILMIVVVDPHMPILGDARAYHLLANNLADGRGYIRPFDLLRFHLVVPTAEYPPLHPFVLSLFARVGMRTVEAQRLGLAMFGTATVAIIGQVGRRICGTTVGLAAAAIAAVSPMMFLPEATSMSETLFVFLVSMVLLLADRARLSPTPARFAALGVAVGLATLTRAEAGVLGLLIIIPLAATAQLLTLRRRTPLAVLALIMVVCVVAPWSARNQATFHKFVPVANNSDVFAGANCALTYSGPTIGSWRATFGTGDLAAGTCFSGYNGTQPHFNEAAASAKARQQGIDYARDHASRWPIVAAARLGRTFGVFRPRQQIQLEALEGRPERWERLGTWFEWALYPFAGAGLILIGRRRTASWPLFAALISVVVATLLTYGNQRFRIGAEPTILIGAAAGIVALIREARSRLTPMPA